MSELSDRERRVLLAHKVFELEKEIFAAQREVSKAKQAVEVSKIKYKTAVASAVGCKVADLQFSDSMACFGTKLVMHCVWDLRPPNVRWLHCVFCGSPRDGE